jgi:hypothetical protein
MATCSCVGIDGSVRSVPILVWRRFSAPIDLIGVLELWLLADEHFVLRFRVASRVPSGF